MKAWIKAWMGFAAIAGIGFGVGFFAGARFGRKKEAERQSVPVDDADIPARLDTTTVKLDSIQKSLDIPAATVVVDRIEPSLDTVYSRIIPGEYVSNVEDVDLDAQAKEMNEYFAQFESPGEEETEESALEDVAERELEKSPEGDTYIQIVSEDVWDSNTEYNPVSLRYFDEDEVVADESDDRVEDPEDHIGHQVLGYFADFDDLETQYVINTWTMEIYEITRVRDAYARAILGLDEDFEFYRTETR